MRHENSKKTREAHEKHKKLVNSDASKALTKLGEYTKQFAKMPFNQFTRQVEGLIENTDEWLGDMTPLLKAYDVLSKGTKFELPKKELLRYDQRVFFGYLRRFRNAQELEIKWLREHFAVQAKQVIKEEVTRVRDLMK